MIDIDVIDILEPSHKEKISKALCDKIMEQIAAIKIDKRALKISEMIEREIANTFDDGGLINNVDFDEVGKALTRLLVGKIQSA